MGTEIELSRPDELFPKPAWLGKEVSDDPRYTNVSLARYQTIPSNEPQDPRG
jgi:adenylate cyclase